MSRFLKNVLFFSLPILLISFGLELYLRNYQSDYLQKNQGILRQADSTEIIILGNSHAFNDIDPTRFEHPAYNLAGLNQSLYFDKRIALKYLDSLDALRYVLINVDYHSLYFSSQGIRDVWSYYAYKIPYQEKNYLKERMSYFWFGYTPRITLSMIKDQALRALRGEPGDSLKLGWAPLTNTEPQAFDTGTLDARANWFNDLVEHSDELSYIRKDLEGFIVLLEKRGIQPILFSAPMVPELKEKLHTEVIERNKGFIDTLSAKYNLPYWDLSDAIQDRGLFFNGDHLNVKGSAVFSSLLNQKLRVFENRRISLSMD